MKKFLQKLWHKVSSKYFWRNNRRRLFFIAGSVVIVAMILVLLISGQRDIGTQEAGHQLNLLAQNIRRYYKTKPDFWGLDTRKVIENKIYPSSMTTEGDVLKGYFGTPTTIGSNLNGAPVMPSGKQFVLAFHDLSRLQCLELGSYKFNSDFWFGVTKMSLSNAGGTQEFEWGSNDFGLPAKKTKLKMLCRSQNNTIAFYFE